jgi:hypothetical protein
LLRSTVAEFKEIKMILKTALGILLFGAMAFAQSEHHEGSHSAHHDRGVAEYPCPMLKADHDQMTRKMAAMDEKVSQLAGEMKRAQGEQKIEAMESLLSTLIEQRVTIHNEMISMLPKMMDWVARHQGAESHECSHAE